MSADPTAFFGCDAGAPYGNSAFFEDNLARGPDQLVYEDPSQLVCEDPNLVQPPLRGLAGQQVVPDDFVGPLQPGWVRQSDYDDLQAHGFGNFDVVGADHQGDLAANQMTEAQYASLQDAWMRMNRGQGISLQGSEADVATYKSWLADGMASSPQFRQMITDQGNGADTLTYHLGRDQERLKMDSFERDDSLDAAHRYQQRGHQTIDLDDYQMVPGTAPTDHPNAQTRSQKIIHAMVETGHGRASTESEAGVRYEQAHRAAIDAENTYRVEQGQSGLRGQDDPHADPGAGQEDWLYDYETGFEEHWDWTGTDLNRITYTEPP